MDAVAVSTWALVGATVVLAITTGVYAFFTKKQADLLKLQMQVTALQAQATLATASMLEGEPTKAFFDRRRIIESKLKDMGLL